MTENEVTKKVETLKSKLFGRLKLSEKNNKDLFKTASSLVVKFKMGLIQREAFQKDMFD